jgi:hypothetical protein
MSYSALLQIQSRGRVATASSNLLISDREGEQSWKETAGVINPGTRVWNAKMHSPIQLFSQGVFYD